VLDDSSELVDSAIEDDTSMLVVVWVPLDVATEVVTLSVIGDSNMLESWVSLYDSAVLVVSTTEYDTSMPLVDSATEEV